MNARLFLRGAAVITLLLTVGHALGSPWTPVHTPPGVAVVTAMKSYRFPAMGFERTYYEFYVGFGWLLAAYAAAHAVIFWQLAGLSSQFPGKLAPDRGGVMPGGRVRDGVGMELSFLGPYRVFRGHCSVPRSGMEVDAAGHGGGGLTRWRPDTGGSRRTGGAESFHQAVGEFPAFREESGFDPLILAVRAHVFEVEEVRGRAVARHAGRAGVL